MGNNRLIRRLTRTVATLGLVLGAGLATTGTASAEDVSAATTCSVGSDYTVCLDMVPAEPGYHQAHVTIMVAEGDDADDIIAWPGDAFSASLLRGTTVLGPLSLVSETAVDGVLQAELTGTFPDSALTSSVRARVKLFNGPAYATRTFTTRASVVWF
jgi:hypothetical protein